MFTYLLPFSFAFFTVVLFIPFLRKIAFKYKFVDIPNKRKIHQEPIPLLGGVALFVSFILNVFLWVDSYRLQLAFLLSGILIVGIGLIDDFYKTRKRDLSALPKILVQFIVAIILFSFGIRIEGISHLIGKGMVIFTPGISLLITVIWIVGLMNMLNFLDGLDGLASGISVISSMTLFIISFIKGQETVALLSITMMGTGLGFLKYNYHPAKIFMGDAGSVFLGLVLAAISIEGTIKSATLLSIIVVVLALGVPIFDTVLVIFNRWKNKRPIYVADQSHAHHRLLKKGYTHQQAVTYIYVISVLFSLASLLVLIIFAL